MQRKVSTRGEERTPVGRGPLFDENGGMSAGNVLILVGHQEREVVKCGLSVGLVNGNGDTVVARTLTGPCLDQGTTVCSALVWFLNCLLNMGWSSPYLQQSNSGRLPSRFIEEVINFFFFLVSITRLILK